MIDLPITVNQDKIKFSGPHLRKFAKMQTAQPNKAVLGYVDVKIRFHDVAATKVSAKSARLSFSMAETISTKFSTGEHKIADGPTLIEMYQAVKSAHDFISALKPETVNDKLLKRELKTLRHTLKNYRACYMGEAL